jgi:hypothetical protein
MPRVTVYVSDELKARMDASGDDLNWSNIAQIAFSSAIATNEIRKGVKDMTAVVERLRASKQRVEAEWRTWGKEAGERWAKEDAEYDDLELLSGCNAAGNVDLDTFQRCLDPANNRDAQEWQEFWQNCLGELPPRGSVLAAFIEGALEVYEEVKDKL